MCCKTSLTILKCERGEREEKENRKRGKRKRGEREERGGEKEEKRAGEKRDRDAEKGPSIRTDSNLPITPRDKHTASLEAATRAHTYKTNPSRASEGCCPRFKQRAVPFTSGTVGVVWCLVKHQAQFGEVAV
jgi:hypothetical protein